MRTLIRETLQVILLALVIFFTIHSMVQTFRVDGISSEPNLHNGQWVLVNKTAYWFGRNPQRGDIVIAQHPAEPGDVIKRIIGLPGETVEVKNDGTVYINGELLEEPYLPPNHISPISGTWPLTDEQYFVMGDNRPSSSDSRYWGPITRNKVIGKAWIIIWPLHDWGWAPNHSLVMAATP